MPDLANPVPCPTCGAPVFIRPNRRIVAHCTTKPGAMGVSTAVRCSASESVADEQLFSASIRPPGLTIRIDGTAKELEPGKTYAIQLQAGTVEEQMQIAEMLRVEADRIGCHLLVFNPALRFLEPKEVFDSPDFVAAVARAFRREQRRMDPRYMVNTLDGAES